MAITYFRLKVLFPRPIRSSLFLFLSGFITQKDERERKSNPELQLRVILAIEPMGACNLNVHMTSQAWNSLVLQLSLPGAYINSERISRATLQVFIDSCFLASLFGLSAHVYTAACQVRWGQVSFQKEDENRDTESRQQCVVDRS